jgi:hypothetical protein
MRAVLITLATTVIVPSEARAQQQHIKVAVEITDTTRQIPSAFAAAFRQLGDVDVVSRSEHPDYVLSGVSLCDPNCDRVGSYAISLRLYSPFSQVSIVVLTARISYLAKIPWGPTRDSVRGILEQRLSYVQVSHGRWVATWGRNVYEQKIREFVREIDYGCFDRDRALKRAVASDDSTAWRKYSAFESSREWLC